MKESKNIKKKYGVVSAELLYVRSGAGKEYNPLKTIPTIEKGQRVEILNTTEGLDGNKWHRIKLSNNIYGYVKA